MENWTTIHKDTRQGLAICYTSTKIGHVRQLHTVSPIKLLPVLMTIDDEPVFLVLIQRPPPPRDIPVFVDSLEIELSQIHSQIHANYYRTIILDDFNLPQNRHLLNLVLPPETIRQHCHYSTYIEGNILDLVFDSKKS